MTSIQPRGMSIDTAAAYVGLSASAIRSAVARGEFPAPVRLLGRRLVFYRDHIDTWLDKKAGFVAAVNSWDDV